MQSALLYKRGYLQDILVGCHFKKYWSPTPFKNLIFRLNDLCIDQVLDSFAKSSKLSKFSFSHAFRCCLNKCGLVEFKNLIIKRNVHEQVCNILNACLSPKTFTIAQNSFYFHSCHMFGKISVINQLPNTKSRSRSWKIEYSSVSAGMA